jgi:hypothetical protein
VEGGRERPGKRRNRLAARRLTLRVSAVINTRHGIPVFTGDNRSSRHAKACSPGGVRATCGRVSRAAKGADCKSAGLRLRRFESYLSHHLENIEQFAKCGARNGAISWCYGCQTVPSVFNGLQPVVFSHSNMIATCA